MDVKKATGRVGAMYLLQEQFHSSRVMGERIPEARMGRLGRDYLEENC